MPFQRQSMRQSIANQRLHVVIRGAVQGVGFRPFIYRLATEMRLVGWVNNSAQGVLVDVEGTRSQLDTFLLRLDQEKPARSQIQRVDVSFLDLVGYATFEIRQSVVGEKTVLVSPDLATCADCLREIFEPSNRRYRYPFTNCTHCGPRFSIIEALPYDRAHTTMQPFVMCSACQAEYENPRDRRFHAQPNACPQCGPHLEVWDQSGQAIAAGDRALILAAEAIRQGQIVAVKGLGGFHLIVDACNGTAVQRLRQAKHRPAKPFAMMYPTLEYVQAHCNVSELEAQLLRSPAAPIVLLKLKTPSHSPLPTPNVAPDNPYLGIMLPYTPLHHLLMHELGFPIVATSGNLTDEPICTDEREALHRLGSIADMFLVHNRAIVCPVDDSIVRVLMEKEVVLRRARGYAPLPILLGSRESGVGSRVLAVGAHLKNTIAFSMDQQVFVSQHLGALETVLAFEVFQQTIARFQQIYAWQPTAIACDLHPDYRSTQFAHQLAKQLDIPVIPVQHHYAHVLSCMAEHQLEGSVLGIAWDGTGYGTDGTLWGGEFLRVTDASWQRVAHLRPFRLPGGDKAAKEPSRTAIGVLHEIFGDEIFERETLDLVQSFSPQALKILKKMLNSRINTPTTTSMGRLFDAIASILGLHQHTQFEGQAAMALEFAVEGVETHESYPFTLLRPSNPSEHLAVLNVAPVIIDWEAMVRRILEDNRSGVSSRRIAAMFHHTLVDMMVAIAQHVGEERVVLTGGCFQNKYLTERAIQRLKAEGFQPYWHQYLSTNDGGIALGQVMAVLQRRSGETEPCA